MYISICIHTRTYVYLHIYTYEHIYPRLQVDASSSAAAPVTAATVAATAVSATTLTAAQDSTVTFILSPAVEEMGLSKSDDAPEAATATTDTHESANIDAISAQKAAASAPSAKVCLNS